MADNSDRPGAAGPSDIRPVLITDEMKRSYLEYAMSVIVSRALPDVRDGLKPVHRRILYAMQRLGLDWNKKHMKSSKVVGDTMGDFHPHGNLAIYDALVRMAQDFSMRVPLIDGQGNFGSVDGDPPAAERYTEVRLSKVAQFLLDDLDKETVDFKPELRRPARGAVGAAGEVPEPARQRRRRHCRRHGDQHPAAQPGRGHRRRRSPCSTIPRSPSTISAQIIHGPDFPTGGLILGRAGTLAAYHKGRGSIIMRAKVEVETVRKDREALIVSAIPYQVNKKTLIEKIADLVREKKIEGISDIWDESNREGMRIVIELKRDAIADVVLNQLWRFSDLQTTFGANMLAINGGRPEQLNLRTCSEAFTAFRQEVVTRRTRHPAHQGARSRPRPRRSRHRRRQHRRGDQADPRLRHRRPRPRISSWRATGRPRDMAPLIELIADPRHKLAENGTYSSPRSRPRRSSSCDLHASLRSAATRSATS